VQAFGWETKEAVVEPMSWGHSTQGQGQAGAPQPVQRLLVQTVEAQALH
jgi:hypothetical protein